MNNVLFLVNVQYTFTKSNTFYIDKKTTNFKEKPKI